MLGKRIHWKQGRSAKSLADSWLAQDDLPPVIRAVLEQDPAYRGAELLAGWLERKTDLGDERGSKSQTDLLALLGTADGTAILAVEAKVSETFDKPVG